MRSLSRGAALAGAVVLGAALTTACSPTFVVLPSPADSTADSLRVVDRQPVRVDTVVRFDTVARVDTVRVRFRPARPGPTGAPRVDTVQVVRHDTVRVVQRDTIFRTRTVVRVDTVARVDTVNLARVDTVTVARVDTVTVARVDTVTVARVDTVVRVDTVSVARAGKRLLFLPPGHYPPEGQCRIWVHGDPPGRQANAAACDGLGPIPAGAFVLFGGEAWDFDYDWLDEARREPGTVPPPIIALQRRRGR